MPGRVASAALATMNGAHNKAIAQGRVVLNVAAVALLALLLDVERVVHLASSSIVTLVLWNRPGTAQGSAQNHCLRMHRKKGKQKRLLAVDWADCTRQPHMKLRV